MRVIRRMLNAGWTFKIEFISSTQEYYGEIEKEFLNARVHCSDFAGSITELADLLNKRALEWEKHERRTPPE